jgi:hypothetical protein
LCSVGNGLNIFIQKNEVFSFIELIILPEIYYPILMFLGLLILSFFIKKKFFK